VARSADVKRIVSGRAIRGFADGFVSVLLAQYLTGLGFSPTGVGAIVTGTLLGSAALTLGFGLRAHRHDLRSLLLVACVMMTATGLGFATFTLFVPLLIVAVLGTLNPSAGDVSVFLPTEQAFVAARSERSRLARVYATYNIAGIWAGALGALCSGIPEALAHRASSSVTGAQRWGFVLYAALAVVILVIYRRLGRTETQRDSAGAPRGALRTARRTVLELTALFSLDAAGGGFVVTSLLVLWLHLRFDLSPGLTGAVFAATGLLGGCSQLLAPRLAARFGLIQTMAFTHMPANVLLALTAFAPTGGVAIAMLLTRSLFAQMDVPARQAFVMAVVPPEERAAASSVTNVPRSLASALTPLIAGVLLTHSTFGWPLLIGGVSKFIYDTTLLLLYRDVPEEPGARRGRQ
jgi:MFS family permease